MSGGFVSPWNKFAQQNNQNKTRKYTNNNNNNNNDIISKPIMECKDFDGNTFKFILIDDDMFNDFDNNNENKYNNKPNPNIKHDPSLWFDDWFDNDLIKKHQNQIRSEIKK